MNRMKVVSPFAVAGGLGTQQTQAEQGRAGKLVKIARKVKQAAEGIQERLERRAWDKVDAKIVDAIAGKKPKKVHGCRVFSHVDEMQSIVFVMDRNKAHKYVHAEAGNGKNYLVVLPLRIAGTHALIADYIGRVAGGGLDFHGGGIVEFKDGKLDVHGESSSFGRGDHARVRRTLLELIDLPQGSQTYRPSALRPAPSHP